MYVKILNGEHRNHPITGVFAVYQDYKEGANGGFITVYTDGKAPFTRERSRIKVTSNDFVYCNSLGEVLDEDITPGSGNLANRVASTVELPTDYETQFIQQESEEDAIARMEHTFHMLEEVTSAAASGVVTGLVVSGPPGIGKSSGVEATLNRENLFRNIQSNEKYFEIIGGAASPIGIYKTLYLNRFKGYVTVFDDCDNILYDEMTLNLLKNALDSKPVRRLAWRFESRVLKDEEIPRDFEFEGSVIFLTNIDFENTRSAKIKTHLKAIMDRVHYLDLEISSQRDRLLRIKQIVQSGMLNDYNFNNNEEKVIIDYIIDNADFLRDLSLRTVKKLADIIKMSIENGFTVEDNKWEPFAEATLMHREAKFKRYLNEANAAKDAEYVAE